MEDRNLNEKESIEIITSMISRTKRRLCLGDGNILLFWGYLTVAVAALVLGLLLITKHPAMNWLWFLIWIIGGTVSPHIVKKKRTETGMESHFDTISAKIWKIVGWSAIASTFTCLAFLLFGGIDCWSMMLVFTFIMVGFAEYAQGIIIKEKPLIFGGATGILTGIFTMCCIAGGVTLYVNWYIPLFIITFICMMVIPGHILNAKARKNR